VVYNSSYDVKTLELSHTSFDDAPTVLSVDTNYFEDFPSVPAALQCWNMARRVLSYQSGILFNNSGLDLTVSSSGPLAAQRAQEQMVAYYAQLGEFMMDTIPLTAGPNMKYFRGTLERTPPVQVNDTTGESFLLDPADFPLFETVKTALAATPAPYGFTYPARFSMLDFSVYRPVEQALFFNNLIQAYGNPIRPLAPDEKPTWLPSGMYRHAENANRLALFVANPWGVQHAFMNGSTETRVAMNPFTFDFANPTSGSATLTYPVKVTFDPARYGFVGQYRVQLVRYGNGGLLGPVFTQTKTGVAVLNTNLGGFEFAAMYFTDI